MKCTAKCLSVQKYMGSVSVDSGTTTTDEKRAVMRVVDGRMMEVLELVHPAGQGHPIFVNQEQTMFRVNFSFQAEPLVVDITLVGIAEDKYVEGQSYEIELNIA